MVLFAVRERCFKPEKSIRNNYQRITGRFDKTLDYYRGNEMTKYKQFTIGNKM